MPFADRIATRGVIMFAGLLALSLVGLGALLALSVPTARLLGHADTPFVLPTRCSRLSAGPHPQLQSGIESGG